jgi:tetratricopeptide (TPR) repeat protein
MKAKKYLIIAMALPFFSVMAQNQAPDTQGQPAQGSAKTDTASSDTTANKNNSDTNPWLNPDFKSYVKALDELVKLSDDYAQNKYRLALANYQTGKSLMQKMRESVQRFREESEETLRLNEKWYWQTMDRKNHEEKKINEDKRIAKLKAVTYFTRAVRHLDEIENPKVKESAEYKALLSNIYRDWAMAQYDLGNIPQIIDVLNRYISLDRKYEEIAEPHKYLSSAYAFQEKMLVKYGQGSDQDITYFKKMKNKHLLRATEIMYGKTLQSITA